MAPKFPFRQDIGNIKTILYLLLVFPLVLLLASCRATERSDATALPESTKGYELYSWQEGNQWRFSLLVGTNRQKTLDEIKSPNTILADVDALIAALEKVPSGQYVTWSSRETLALPPDSILEQICKNNGLVLNMAQ